MPTTTKRKPTTRHKGRVKHASFRRHAEDASPNEVQQLREQILHLRSTITEQEASIDFLRDLLAQRWFDVDDNSAKT